MGNAGTRLTLCGRLSVVWDGEELEPRLPGRQGRLLFAYLALNRERPVRRDELVEALWSDEGTPAGADGLLAPPLSRLRKALGAGRLEGRAELELVLPADTWVDWESAHSGLARARASLDAGRWREGWQPAQDALVIAERGLLPGLEAVWIDERRRELADLRVELLEAIALLGARLGGSETALAEQAARSAIEAAPFRESAHGALMEALMARGNSAEAMRAFDDVRVMLRDELGTNPGPALMAIHERLLRGEAEPAPAERPPVAAVPDRLAQTAGTPLIGRRAPLERLRAELRRARDGEPGVVLLAGEGGIGKTRLAAELAADADDFIVLYGRCDEEALFPYGPWIEMFDTLLESAGDADLASVLGDGAPVLARLLPELRARMPNLTIPPAQDPETERRRLFHAVVGVARRLASRTPLLLVIDDLHWADRSSLLLLRQVVRAPQLGPVLIVGTYRDNELPPRHPLLETLADLERERTLPRLHLLGLEDDEVGELMAEGNGKHAEDSTVRAIREETGGNPFFVKQLVRHLEEGGRPTQRPSGIRFGVPQGLRDVIASRVARLPERSGTVLSVASLIGREFDLALLERVTELPESDLLDVLDAAVHAGLLIESPTRPGHYAFAHALLRTTLEDTLTTTRRARIHRAIGVALEQLHADRLDASLADLARHFTAAGPDEAERLVRYSVLAADQAADQVAYEEAEQLTQGALVAVERGNPVNEEQHGKILVEHSKSVWHLGRFELARELCARAADAARIAGDVNTFAEAAFDHSGGGWERYGTEDKESVALLEEALTLLPPEDSQMRARVTAQLGLVLYHSPGTEERQVELVEEAIAMARRLGHDHALGDALGAAQYAYWRPGLAETRLRYADELIEAVVKEGRLHFEADVRAWRATALLELCRIEQVDAEIARHHEIVDQLQQPQLLVHAEALASMRALLVGDWAEGESHAHAILGAGERSEAVDARQYFGVAMVGLLNEQGRLGEMIPTVETLVRDAGAAPAWRCAHAWALVQGGREADARAVIEDLRSTGYELFPNDANLLTALGLLGHIAEELGDADLARDLRPLLAPYADLWVVVGPGAATLGPVAYSLAVVDALRGDADNAVAGFEHALELSESMGARPYVARSSWGLASALRTRGDDGDTARADQLAERALTLARELSMSRLLAQAEPARR